MVLKAHKMCQQNRCIDLHLKLISYSLSQQGIRHSVFINESNVPDILSVISVCQSPMNLCATNEMHLLSCSSGNNKSHI